MRKIIFAIVAVKILMFPLTLFGADRQELALQLLEAMEMKDRVLSANEMYQEEMYKIFVRKNYSKDQKEIVKKYTGEMAAAVTRQFDWNKIKIVYAKKYAEVFTEDQLIKLTEFFKSKSGKAYSNNFIELERFSMDYGGKLFKDIEGELSEISGRMGKALADLEKVN